ncbi:MAG: FAD-dependent oxidoreductase [Desulfobacteraceae bacterium]|nr:FAD-dependent oxidoreductase [Desulfobacteraceae bacterium]
MTIGRVTLPNRICFTAHRSNLGGRGRVTDRRIAYYRRRAAGGCGMLTVGEISIDKGDRPSEFMIESYRAGAAKDLQKLTRDVHKYETPVFAQLNHHGFQSSGAITRQAVLGPSAVADIVYGEAAKAMEPEDMADVGAAFARAAAVMRESGFDGIEIDMGPRSLLRQFLSLISNHRQDEYGDSMENRMRFPLEILNRVRESIGADFTVGIRLCVDEQFYGGITPQDAQQFARGFERSGAVDFIETYVGTYYNLQLVRASMHIPLGGIADATAQIKEAVSLPVLTGHQIVSFELARSMVAEKKADAVGFVRPLICDPDMPNKAGGKIDGPIRYCVRDNKGCIGRVNQGKTISCIQNPEVGYETLEPVDLPGSASIPKQVMVVGAGPAGLEAARAAAVRGHKVTVYEKADITGGQTNLHQIAAGRQPIIQVTRYLEQVLDDLGVSVVTNTEVTPGILSDKPVDAVVIATGSRPDEKPYPGDYGPPSAVTVWNVLNADYPIGEKVLVIDEMGSHFSTATAEFLADQGKTVDLLSPDLFVGMELASVGDLYFSRQRLLQKGVTFMPDITVDKIRGTGVKARNIYSNIQIDLKGYDTIVLAAGNLAEDNLYKQLKGKVNEIYRVGDCVAPRGIDMAVFEGRKVGGRL